MFYRIIWLYILSCILTSCNKNALDLTNKSDCLVESDVLQVESVYTCALLFLNTRANRTQTYYLKINSYKRSRFLISYDDEFKKRDLEPVNLIQML